MTALAPISNALRALLASGLATNGLAMLLAPQRWYHAVPGVVFTGPFNPHFVRDIGAAYLSAAVGLGWRAAAGARAWPAAALGALFLLLHAGVHLVETLLGLCGWAQFAADVPGVVLPALMALALALPGRSIREVRHAG